MIKPYYKLVRDKYPDYLKNKKIKTTSKRLNDSEYVYYLKLRLKEQIQALINSQKKEDIALNFAETKLLIKTLQQQLKISDKEVNLASEKENKRYGKYSKKIFLILTEE